jgi:hypothetical protein
MARLVIEVVLRHFLAVAKLRKNNPLNER